MAKTRSWSGEKATTSADIPNYAALDSARESFLSGHTSVTDAVAEFGGTNALAKALLSAKGNETPTKSQLNGQMRNIQRYLQYEKTGVKNKNSFAPAKAARSIINTATAKEKAKNSGITVKMKGEMSVQGYKRNRNISFTMSGDEAEAFLDDPSFEALAEAYGVNELIAYDDNSISIE